MDTQEISRPKEPSFLLAEYNALRDEIVKRMDIEHQLATFNIIVFGTILGFGFQYSKIAPLLLLYPTLTLFLSIGWCHSDNMTILIGKYIKEHVESIVGLDSIGWEHYGTYRYSRYYWAMRGIFISTQVLAIVVGVAVAPLNTTFTVVLLCIAIVSLLLTIFFIFHPAPIKLRKLLRIDKGQN